MSLCLGSLKRKLVGPAGLAGLRMNEKSSLGAGNRESAVLGSGSDGSSVFESPGRKVSLGVLMASLFE